MTSSIDIENRRTEFQNLFSWIEVNTDIPIPQLQTAWSFHTSSTESIVGPLISMRNDALERTGNGIGCHVENNEIKTEDGNISHWLITGTFTAPQYTESFFPPTLIRRASDDDRTPVFVENREIPFWLVIPYSAVTTQEPADLVIWGHGFLGNGNTNSLSGWANEYNMAMLGTSFYGWADDDFASIEFAVLNMHYFQHQAERLEQAMINQVIMIKTFMGICSDLPDFYHDEESYKMINTSNPTYTGYSNGAIRPASLNL